MYRKTAQAGFFYPAEPEICKKALRECIPETIEKTWKREIVAAIVPHAGWSFSGPTAGKAYRAIAQQESPDTFVIFGAVHTHGVTRPSLWKAGKWQTPLGDIEIDEELSGKILGETSPIHDHSNAHVREHSIEVQVPFLKLLFPKARIVPIMVPPMDSAAKIGEYVASKIGEKKVIALGSTDMTHYGTRFGFAPAGLGKQGLDWVKQENDRRMLDIILNLEIEKIVPEAEENWNACGSGAISATVGFARFMGRSSGTLLEYTTSWDVHPEGEIDTFVGYASVVF